MLRQWLRKLLLPILCAYLLYNKVWGLALFAFGYFLGELHSDKVAIIPSPLPAAINEKPERFKRLKNILRTLLLTITILTGLYLASYPREMKVSKKTTGYQFLLLWTPSKYPIGGVNTRYDRTNDFWPSIGAMLIA